MLKMSSMSTSRRNNLDAIERQQSVLENLAEVRYIARRIHTRLPPHVPFEDLVQAGILGLIDSVDRFDPQKNVQFLSYARFRIRGAILDSLRQMDWGPRGLRHQARGIEQASHELTGQLGHVPSGSEIACKLGLPMEQFQRLLSDLNGLKLESLHLWFEEGTDKQAVPIACRIEEDPFQMTFQSEIRHLLREALLELDSREGTVLGLYYLEEFKMKRIGEILGVAESRVSQIHAEALRHLRSLLRGIHFFPFPTITRSTAAPTIAASTSSS